MNACKRLSRCFRSLAMYALRRLLSPGGPCRPSHTRRRSVRVSDTGQPVSYLLLSTDDLSHFCRAHARSRAGRGLQWAVGLVLLSGSYAFAGWMTQGEFSVAIEGTTALILSQLGGGILQAGGQIAGGLIGGEGGGTSNSIVSGGPGADPLQTLLAVQSAAELGAVDPALLQRQSPVNQALAVFAAFPGQVKSRRRAINALGKARNFFFETGALPSEVPAKFGKARNLARRLGLNLDEIILAEAEFQERLPERMEQLQEIASRNAAEREAISNQLSSILRGLPQPTTEGIRDLREQERARLLRQIDETRQDTLRTANLAGFNPGRALGDIAELEQEADLEALGRALNLLSGQTNIASSQATNLQNLLNIPTAQATNIASLRSGTPATISTVQNPPSPIGPAIARAGASLGGAVSTASLLKALEE